MSEPGSARGRYQSRLQELAAVHHELDRRNSLLVLVRTVLFFLAAILLVSGYIGAEPRGVLLTIGWCSAAGFLIAITIHEHIRLTELKVVRQEKLYERLLARLDRRWDDLGSTSQSTVDAGPTSAGSFSSSTANDSAIADDLDLFGSASLWQLLAMPGTGFGRSTLKGWLLTVPAWPVLTQRQAAVKELREATGPREQLIDLLATISDNADNASQLAHWASGPRWLPKHRIAHALSFAGPGLVLIGSLVLLLFGSGDASETTPIWIGVGLLGTGLAINLILTLGWGSWMHDIFLRVTGSNRDSNQLSAIFEAIGKLPGESDQIIRLRNSAAGGDQSAVAGFQSLLWRVRMANLQRDPIFYIVYLVLQLAIAWDFRVMQSLERWQVGFGSASHGWFEALGECEALLSAATLADEYRDWCFPEPCSDSETIFQLTRLGHPLVADQARVTNDVRLERAKPLLLVTGSNMAGKSTLLRSLGLNQILARVGAPVCATTFCSPLFDLATSIRVRDSLKEGVSFFMAELKRLKQVIDIAERASHGSNDLPPVMFLLDEILQGTNSRERQIAVIKVLEGLLERKAIGAISTHDLELADQTAIINVSQIVHFREYFEGEGENERMRFDYVMRPGPTPTTNALKLLKLVGI